MIEVRLLHRFPAGRDSAAFTLDLEFQAGAGIMAVFGPSGAGKTLTLDAIAGFVRPEQGRILLDDRILFDSGANVHLAPQQRHCGYVFQNYALFPHMTLRENLEFATGHLPALERRRRIAEMLDAFRLVDVAGRRPHELSGGQKQRCSIARALIASPRILLLDEPARGLDTPLRAEFYAVLRQVRDQFSTPILLVTHDLDECFELASDMILVNAGKIVQRAKPVDLLQKPATADAARLLGQYNLLQAEIITLDPGRNSSVLRYEEHELSASYLPGHLKGDRVWICMRPDELRATPRNGASAPNQVPVTLERAIELPGSVRLEFTNGFTVITTGPPDPQTRDWYVEFPPDRMRVI